MTVKLFDPMQLVIQEFEFDNASVLERDYIKLKGEYSIDGLKMLIMQIITHTSGVVYERDWATATKTTARSTNGELFYMLIGHDNQPIIIARACSNGRYWTPYIAKIWGPITESFHERS